MGTQGYKYYLLLWDRIAVIAADGATLLGLLFDGTADKMDGALRILLITCRFSVFSWWFQLKSVFLQQIFELYKTIL